MDLNVFLHAYGTRLSVGRLKEIGRRIFFEYDESFLQKEIPLSPFHLPLQRGVFEETSGIFDGLFGVFNDSLPDGWGSLLLDRRLREQGLSYSSITPLHRLSLIGQNPMGALEYEPAEECAMSNFGVELDSLSREVENILHDYPSSALDQLVQCNGSSGGARPKLTAYVSEDFTKLLHATHDIPEGYSSWIIKFSEQKDGVDFGEKEYRFSLAAKAAGIIMPPTHLFPSNCHAGYFGVQRFDRTPAGKVHVHSACGLLHASHRYPSLDYENLLKLTVILTKDYDDVKQMVLRMIFNVLSGNKDDHSKNFSFILDQSNRWHLSPAYDLTPSEGINGEQTAMVNGKGREISPVDLIATALRAGVPEQETCQMISAVESSLAEYNCL